MIIGEKRNIGYHPQTFIFHLMYYILWTKHFVKYKVIYNQSIQIVM